MECKCNRCSHDVQPLGLEADGEAFWANVRRRINERINDLEAEQRMRDAQNQVQDFVGHLNRVDWQRGILGRE